MILRIDNIRFVEPEPEACASSSSAASSSQQDSTSSVERLPSLGSADPGFFAAWEQRNRAEQRATLLRGAKP